ncbi:uncharacterized protein SPSK_01434 [Sporothrix schenckii 1099-18]|uniref:AAA+ ATPase domain-containing protein n=1 Tax=Sporothrix schenckii 1099-18 TaxID=1397361 RepID=A0A0F2MB92_SPOSC|nr:uncharacterized protein SPSK_01434 [Sporothrix schenckii 1099-18]KJR86917.1 hypothetical protein SPSK_01434 [Sporothrix schenckii 1099-18]
MEYNSVIAEYEKILGGQFLPKVDELQAASGKTTAAPADANGAAGLASVPEGALPAPGSSVFVVDDAASVLGVPPGIPVIQTAAGPSNAGANAGAKVDATAEANAARTSQNINNSGKNGKKKKGQKGKGDDFIPDLKKVVQFSDGEGKKRVIGLETYKFKTYRSRYTQVLAEAEEKPFRDYAILLKADVNDNPQGGIKADFTLEIQSDGLKHIFRTIAKRYRELTLDTGDEPIVIEYPFRCLFFLRTRLRELQHDPATAASTRRELANLVDFIHAPIGHDKIIETYNSLVPHGKITFPMVWTLFPPYEPVLAIHPGLPLDKSSCFLVESVSFSQEKNEPCWEIEALFGYHDGTRFYLKSETKTIRWFDGVKDIHNDHHLSLLPLSLIEESRRAEIREALIRRGKLYVDYCTRDFSFMHYTGYVDLVNRDSEKQLKALGAKNSVYVDTRVIIDRTAENKISNADDDIGRTVSSCLTEHFSTTSKREISLTSSSMPVMGVHQRLRDLVQSNFGSGSGAGDHDKDDDIDVGGAADKEGDGDAWMLDPKTFAPQAFELTDEDYLICRRNVVAFLLDQKLWVYYCVISNLREIAWKADPFNSLQLSSDKKRLVHRLVKGFDGGSKADMYDDLIEGKGKGLIFLLHGAPGLGKTLTAESVSESTRRPLYHVSTGELSIEVKDLEKQLSEIFRLGARWNAVVLLDEADVLMSQRTTQDLRRNAIVAVFLRMLEYYRGMLFLTTNRHDDFDNAFYNRIHVTIEYGELTKEWRANIWREHVQRACRRNKDPLMWCNDVEAEADAGPLRPAPDATSKEATSKEATSKDVDGADGPPLDPVLFSTLGEVHSNGRDIKNYVRTSLAFAHSEKEDLGLEQVLIVLENNLPRSVVTAHRDVLERLHVLSDRQVRQHEARQARVKAEKATRKKEKKEKKLKEAEERKRRADNGEDVPDENADDDSEDSSDEEEGNSE